MTQEPCVALPTSIPGIRRIATLMQETTAATTPEYIIVTCVVLCGVLSVGTVISHQAEALNPLIAATDKSLGGEQSLVASHEKSQHTDPPTESSALELAKSPAVLIVACANFAMIGLILATLAMRRKRRALPASTAPALQERWTEHASRLLRMLRQHSGGMADWELLVELAMTRDVVTVRPNARLQAIQQAMEKSPHGLVVVADSNGRIAGLIPQESLAVPTGSVASKIMQPEPTTVDHRTTLSSAAKTMIQSGCTAMPVTSEGSVCGIISHVEMTLTLQATLQMLREIEIQHRQALLRTVAPG